MRLISISPSIFYENTPAGLRQLAQVELENPNAARHAHLEVQMEAWRERFALGLVPNARSYHDIRLPDLAVSQGISCQLWTDEVLQFCEQTEDWPEGTKFRWLIEQGYSLVEFIENRPPEVVERLMRFVRNGQIEATASHSPRMQAIGRQPGPNHLFQPGGSSQWDADQSETRRGRAWSDPAPGGSCRRGDPPRAQPAAANYR